MTLPPTVASAVRIEAEPVIVSAEPKDCFDVQLYIHNHSEFTLSSSGSNPVNIAYHWIEARTGKSVVFDGDRTRFEPPLAPGEIQRRLARVSRPPCSGNFILRFSLVQEHVFWFDQVFAPHASDINIEIPPLELSEPGSRSPKTIAENQFWSDYGYHHGEILLRNRPAVFSIEGTNYCNIKCIMCPRGEPDVMSRPLGHMSNELLEKIIDEADFFTNPAWLHWFGEPLMNPQIFEQIATAKRKIPNLGISTNATLLSEANRRNLLNSEVDTIIIAIDGATKSVYERVRKSRRFTYEAVRSNVEAFLAEKKARGRNRPFVILSIISMEATEPDMELFRQNWIARGADEILFKPFTNWAGQYGAEDLATVRDQAMLKMPRLHPCKTLWQNFVIAWDGRVVPCCYDYDAKMVLGNLKVQTLGEIWNGPAYVELRRAELAGRNNSPLCINCTQAPGHPRDPLWGE